MDAASSGVSSAVYGRARPDEGLVQILSATPWAGGLLETIGSVRRGEPIPDLETGISIDGVRLAIALRPDLPMPPMLQLVDVAQGLESRRTGLVPSQGLREKTVMLMGAGSVGSNVGLLLAEAGVGNFDVADNDCLDATNITRHACDLLDLGRSKANAVADLLTRRLSHARGTQEDVLTMSQQELDRWISGIDVVVASTDSPAVQFTINEACVRCSTPGVFIGGYQLAAGGEVITVRPGIGPCFFCAVGFRAGLLEGIEIKERRLAYQFADENRLDAEPGLGADITYLSAAAAAHVLALLDPEGSRADLIAPGREFLLLHGGSKPRGALADLFRAPFDLVHARVRRDDPCPVCGWSSKEDEDGERS